MEVFSQNYAQYYNLLYRDKDYKSESKYIDQLIKKYAMNTSSILNLGCGTGSHDFELASLGYSVVGVDRSKEMVTIAQNSTPNKDLPLEFIHEDIGALELHKKFDVVISLFHVMSYMSTNEELLKAFKTAYNHLNDHSVFIFDCWYGPAVLTERPEVRVKDLEDESIKVTRIAEPIMHPNQNLVDVHYRIFIEDKMEDKIKHYEETHRMRYLFKPEIELLLEQAGFQILDSFEFMTNNPLDYNTWNGCFVGGKK